MDPIPGCPASSIASNMDQRCIYVSPGAIIRCPIYPLIMPLDLTDEETAALEQLLTETIATRSRRAFSR